MVIVFVVILFVLAVLGYRWMKRRKEKEHAAYESRLLRERQDELEGHTHRTMHLWKAKEENEVKKYLYLQDIRNVSRSFRALLQETVEIGREEGDIVISDDRSLSRRHCRIRIEGTVLHLMDLGSSNGTIYDDKIISEEVIIVPNKILKIGRQQFKLKIVEG